MPLRLSKNRVLLDGIPLNESKASNLASAATIDIWSVTGNVVPITGTATIGAFTAAPQAGTKRTLLCIGTPTFTHGANFLLPGAADYTAIAGDRIEVMAITTTQFRLSILQTSVLNFATKSVFPTVGVDKSLYLDKATGLLWRWDTGTVAYVGAPFPLDADGNVIAQVSPRTGLLGTVTPSAGLMGIINAGASEIARATDHDAEVWYPQTVGNAPSINFRNTLVGSIRFNLLGDTAIPNNQAFQIDPSLFAVSPGIASLVTLNTTSATNNFIDFTALLAAFPIQLSYGVIQGNVQWLAKAMNDGTYRGYNLYAGATGTAVGSVAIRRVCPCVKGAAFTGTINNGSGLSGTILTVSAMQYGTVSVGQIIAGTGITVGTKVTAFVSGNGGAGTYTVSVAQLVASVAITVSSSAQVSPVSETFYMLSGMNNVLSLRANHDNAITYPDVASTGSFIINLYAA